MTALKSASTCLHFSSWHHISFHTLTSNFSIFFLLWYHGDSEIKKKDKSLSLWSTMYFGIHIDVMKYCIAFSCSVQPIKLLLSKTWSNVSIIHWPLSQNSLLWIILIPYNWSYKIWYLISNSDMELNFATFAIMSSYCENTEFLYI